MIICGTGHRPDKLGGYDADTKFKGVHYAETLLNQIQPKKVITGGALGWDQWLAEACRNLGVRYVMALPFPGFEERWPLSSKHHLYALMHEADEVRYISEAPYAGWKMQTRNEWMVNNSDQVLALWNGTTGGTGNCVAYAKKVNKPVINVWEDWEGYDGHQA